jgi:hypothetical protein
MVWHGMRRGATLPAPRILPRERLHIRTCLLAYPEMSYREIAERLNAVFGYYNGGCRTHHGVYYHIKTRVRLIAV